MALLSGLPMPKMVSPQDAADSQSGSGMSNFLRLMSLIQGAPGEQAQTAALKQKTDFAKQEHDNLMKGLDTVRGKFSDVRSPEEGLNVLNSNPQLLVDPYTSGWVKQGLDLQKEMQQIKQATEMAKLDFKQGQFETAELGKVVQAVPGEWPRVKETLGKDGRWTPETSAIMQEISPKISAWEREQALLKPSVISAQTAATSREEVARINNDTREAINQSTLDWKSKHQFSRAMPFIEHAQLAEIKGDIANINMLDKAATTGGGDEAKQEAQKAKIRYHNKWDPVLKEASTRANQGESTPAASNYKSAEDVRTDFNAGKIDRATAKKILEDQFNMK